MTDTMTFAAGALVRAAHLRAQADALAGDPDSRVLPLWRLKPLTAAQGGLALLPPGHPMLADATDRLFLGTDAEGRALFAADLARWMPEDQEGVREGFLDPTEQRHPEAPEGAAFRELRAAMHLLGPLEAEIAATARALFGWHEAHRFCARCGAPSVMVPGGWQRDCPACHAHHFPRTDPVVIMLITRGNAALIGRSPGWPEGMYSLLAGFVEPGETVEAAVRREVAEEAGITVGEVRYLASQPWPFPASLMIGCAGEALDAGITRDPTELEDARWITREEMVEVFAGTHPAIRAPRRGAIAYHLMRYWLAQALD